MCAAKPITYKFQRINGIPFSLRIDQKWMEELARSFPLRPDDLFIVTYPKSGTTWMQQIVKLIRTGGVEDGVHPMKAIPWLEAIDSIFQSEGRATVDCSALPSPRMFKSHTNYFMMPGGDPAKSPAKYIYMARNPKDTAVSLFYHARAFPSFEYEGDWDDFFERFMIGEVESGSWFEHVLEWWEHRDSPNILFVKYEDMKKAPRKTVEEVAKFMACELEPAAIDNVITLSTFDSMKVDVTSIFPRKPGSQPHLRKGIIGDWKSHFSAEQSARMDAEYDKRVTSSGLEFEFD